MRYNFTSELSEVVAHYSNLQRKEILSSPLFNVAPTLTAPVLVMKEDRSGIEMFLWLWLLRRGKKVDPG